MYNLELCKRRLNQDITYNAYNLIDDIKEKYYDDNTNELKFYYGTNEYRNKMEMLTNYAVDSTKYYAGNYEVTTKTGENTFVRSATYIPSPTGLAAVFIKDSRDEQQPEGRMFYILKDHLGSITALVNEAGDLQQEYSFDAWGRRRHPDTWQCFSTEELQNFKPLVSRGYTGHEQLDRFGLINMNGRLYDLVLGRMLSPDNFVQNPLSSQDFNRYSYCFNNPLKYIDPSGEDPALKLLMRLFCPNLSEGLYNYLGYIPTFSVPSEEVARFGYTLPAFYAYPVGEGSVCTSNSGGVSILSETIDKVEISDAKKIVEGVNGIFHEAAKSTLEEIGNVSKVVSSEQAAIKTLGSITNATRTMGYIEIGISALSNFNNLRQDPSITNWAKVGASAIIIGSCYLPQEEFLYL